MAIPVVGVHQLLLRWFRLLKFIKRARNGHQTSGMNLSITLVRFQLDSHAPPARERRQTRLLQSGTAKGTPHLGCWRDPSQEMSFTVGSNGNPLVPEKSKDPLPTEPSIPAHVAEQQRVLGEPKTSRSFPCGKTFWMIRHLE